MHDLAAGYPFKTVILQPVQHDLAAGYSNFFILKCLQHACCRKLNFTNFSATTLAACITRSLVGHT